MVDDIGDKVIGDTFTHIDFPYYCHHCGQPLKIEDRHRWSHKCTVAHRRNFAEQKERRHYFEEQVRSRPIVERYSKNYQHGQANQTVWQRLKKKILHFFS